LQSGTDLLTVVTHGSGASASLHARHAAAAAARPRIPALDPEPKSSCKLFKQIAINGQPPAHLHHCLNCSFTGHAGVVSCSAMITAGFGFDGDSKRGDLEGKRNQTLLLLHPQLLHEAQADLLATG
jgi:hypothetical protein